MQRGLSGSNANLTMWPWWEIPFLFGWAYVTKLVHKHVECWLFLGLCLALWKILMGHWVPSFWVLSFKLWQFGLEVSNSSMFASPGEDLPLCLPVPANAQSLKQLYSPLPRKCLTGKPVEYRYLPERLANWGNFLVDGRGWKESYGNRSVFPISGH